LLLTAAGGRDLLAAAFALLGLAQAAANVSWGPLLAGSVEGAERMVSAYALSAALSLLPFSLGAALTWPLLGHAPQAGDALAAYKLGLAASALLFALCARRPQAGS